MTAAELAPRRRGDGAEPELDEAALWKALDTEHAAQARERLFTAHYGFARMIAARHFRDRRSGDIDFADLAQLASTGLLEAIDRFKPEMGVPFRRYAGRRISGSIVDGIAKMSEVRQQISFRNRMRRERVRSLCEPGADQLPTPDALEALIETAVSLALGFMLEGTGLYVTEDERDSAANAYENLAWKEAVQRIRAEVESLPSREQSIIRRHYFDGMSFEQIAALLGVTKGRVSQLHKAAMALIRKRLQASRAFKLER